MPDLITTQLVDLDLSATDRHQATQALAELLLAQGRVTDLAGFLADVRAREQQMPTGIEGGIGIPHARSAHVTEPTLGFGRMAMGEPAYGSATPAGIMRLLKHNEISLKGKDAVIVGRSPILGKPLAMMFLNEHATVTICHSRTQNLPEIVHRAEVVVGAVGKPEFIKGDWIRDGAIVIDAGYHPEKVGDIELSAVIDRCAAYTPVPGGVGPMTIATLIAQTTEAAEKSVGLS